MTQQTLPAPAESGRQSPYPFAFLRDQKPLSSSEWRVACRVREEIQALVRGREAYIDQRHLDREIHLPRGIWQLQEGGLYEGYRIVSEGGYEIINHLRLFAQSFTGYRLAAMEFAEGKPFPRETASELDRHLATLAGRPDVFVSRYQHATSQLPEELQITPPLRFGEVGWRVGGKIVSYDTYVYLERIVLLHECGVLERLKCKQRAVAAGEMNVPLRILEIGGGFGGLAHHLRKLLPASQYFIVDIPESLMYSAIYLSVLHSSGRNRVLPYASVPSDLRDPNAGFTFVSNFFFDNLLAADLKFDLVINTLSMSEMAEKQVRYYCNGITRLLGDDGVFFEQNQANAAVHRGLDAKTIIKDYFPHQQRLSSHVLGGLTQGQAHLWSRTPLPS